MVPNFTGVRNHFTFCTSEYPSVISIKVYQSANSNYSRVQFCTKLNWNGAFIPLQTVLWTNNKRLAVFPFYDGRGLGECCFVLTVLHYIIHTIDDSGIDIRKISW